MSAAQAAFKQRTLPSLRITLEGAEDRTLYLRAMGLKMLRSLLKRLGKSIAAVRRTATRAVRRRQRCALCLPHARCRGGWRRDQHGWVGSAQESGQGAA